MKDEQKLDILIRGMEKIISTPIAPVAPVAPILPLAPVNPDDHNLLIKLDTKVDALKEDIKTLSDNTTARLIDHETRIRLLETGVTRVMTFGAAGVIILGIAQFLIGKYL